MEINFEDVVKLSDFRSGTLEKTSSKGFFEKKRTSWGFAHTQKVGESGVLGALGLIDIQQAARSRGADNWDRERREEHEGSGTGDVGLGDRWGILLGEVSSGERCMRGAEQVVVSAPGGSVEEIVLGNEEDTGEFLVVVGHHNWLWWTLAEVKKSVDILNRSESFLPQLELDGNVQLLETGVQMSLKSFGVVEVDGVHLCRVFGGILNMVAEKFAKTAEFGLSGVLLAEFESLKSGRLVHDLETGIVSENVENGTVGLPQELQPWGDDGAVGTVLCLFTGDGRQKNRFWGFRCLQILNAIQVDLLSLCLGLGNLSFGQLNELLQDQLSQPLASTPPPDNSSSSHTSIVWTLVF